MENHYSEFFTSKPKISVNHGLEIGCSKCVLPIGYKGATFEKNDKGEMICNFCLNHKPIEFQGEEAFLENLRLDKDEKVGVTVSGGKDSLYVWKWLVDHLGADKVIAFNHQKVGLSHKLAEKNMDTASKILNSQIIRIADTTFIDRFRQNLEIFLKKPNPAMIRVALCSGCRYGISMNLYEEGAKLGISKFISAASYLEFCPFKAQLLKDMGDGDEFIGLQNGLSENSSYDHDNNLEIIRRDDKLCHKRDISNKKLKDFSILDFDKYFPNDPRIYEETVRNCLDWERPERSWHFDCQIETFKDLFYYGLLGYTETDFKLSAMIRYELLTREEAYQELMGYRDKITKSKKDILNLMDELNIRSSKGEIEKFFDSSPYLSPTIKIEFEN